MYQVTKNFFSKFPIPARKDMKLEILLVMQIFLKGSKFLELRNLESLKIVQITGKTYPSFSTLREQGIWKKVCGGYTNIKLYFALFVDFHRVHDGLACLGQTIKVKEFSLQILPKICIIYFEKMTDIYFHFKVNESGLQNLPKIHIIYLDRPIGSS